MITAKQITVRLKSRNIKVERGHKSVDKLSEASERLKTQHSPLSK